MSHTKNNFLGAIAILIGNIVGAGVFGLPYVVSRAGFLAGLVHLVILGFVVWITTLAYGEVVLRTKSKHQLPGYAERYLGKWGKGIVMFSLIFGIYGALIAYAIEVGNFLSVLLEPFLPLPAFTYGLIFYAIASFLIWFGLKTVAKIEMFMVFMLLFVIILIAWIGVPEINTDNLVTFYAANMFLPYGVILFAFAGASAIPSVAEILKNRRDLVKKAITAGILLPFVVYFIFVLVVVGVTGEDTTEGAVEGLGAVLGSAVLNVGAIFGVLSMTTSFLILGYVLREIYQLDYKLPKIAAWFLVVIFPLIIYILRLTTFIETMGLVGAVMGGFDGIIILLMHKKVQRYGIRNKSPFTLHMPEPVRILLMTLFACGIVYEIYFLLF
ncbi:MAG: aromatic amino acid transport family protein [bacterium]